MLKRYWDKFDEWLYDNHEPVWDVMLRIEVWLYGKRFYIRRILPHLIRARLIKLYKSVITAFAPRDGKSRDK